MHAARCSLGRSARQGSDGHDRAAGPGTATGCASDYHDKQALLSWRIHDLAPLRSTWNCPSYHTNGADRLMLSDQEASSRLTWGARISRGAEVWSSVQVWLKNNGQALELHLYGRWSSARYLSLFLLRRSFSDSVLGEPAEKSAHCCFGALFGLWGRSSHRPCSRWPWHKPSKSLPQGDPSAFLSRNLTPSPAPSQSERAEGSEARLVVSLESEL